MPQHYHQHRASMVGLLNQDLGGVFLSYYGCLPCRLFCVCVCVCVFAAVFMSQCRWGLGEPCGSVELGGVTSESDLRCQFEIDVWPWHCQLKIPSHTQLCWHPAIQKYTSLSEWDSTVYLAQTATNEFWDGFLRLRELSPSVFLFPVTQSTPVFYSLSLTSDKRSNEG